jgi:hypothetical protein
LLQRENHRFATTLFGGNMQDLIERLEKSGELISQLMERL